MKDIIVAKFGGSSLADGNQFKKVKAIVESDDRRRFIVPSAPGKRHKDDQKITDLLYLCKQTADHRMPFNEILGIIQDRYQEIAYDIGVDIDYTEDFIEIKRQLQKGATHAYAASRGEYLNGKLLARYLGYEFIDPYDLIVISRGTGRVRWEDTKALMEERLKGVEKAVIPGFYGRTRNDELITFSRGGSDVTGAVVAKGVGASLYENWTDVSGFLVVDPRIVENPETIEKITYRELRELAYMGASVIHEEAMFPAMQAMIPIHIRNTNDPDARGTLILDENLIEKRNNAITGISGKRGFTAINVDKMLMNSDQGFLSRLLNIFEKYDVSIEHVPSGIDNVSVIVNDREIEPIIEKITQDIQNQLEPDKLTIHSNMAIIVVVGEAMAYQVGVASETFQALAKADINIRMITQGSSEISILVGVESDALEKGIKVIYEAFH